MVLNEQQSNSMPLPRLPHEYGNSDQFSEHSFRYAARQLPEKPAILGNVSVHAVVADGECADLQGRLRRIKGENRGPRQPLGLTVPFDTFLQYVDAASIEDTHLQKLLEDPDELTSRSGAMLFVRAPAKASIGGRMVPECVLSEDGTKIQNYSSIGNSRTTEFLNHAFLEGVEFPVMTSANKSKEQLEIVSNHQAQTFAQERGLAFVPNLPVHDARPKPKGSYAVVEVTARAIRIVRDGFLGKGIIRALFNGYPVERAANARPTNYPEGVVEFDDLPSYAREARGAELRAIILAYLGGKALEE